MILKGVFLLVVALRGEWAEKIGSWHGGRHGKNDA